MPKRTRAWENSLSRRWSPYQSLAIRMPGPIRVLSLSLSIWDHNVLQALRLKISERGEAMQVASSLLDGGIYAFTQASVYTFLSRVFLDPYNGYWGFGHCSFR